MIDKKAEQEAVSVKDTANGGGQVIDIMAAIEASLAAIKKDKPKSKKKTSA